MQTWKDQSRKLMLHFVNAIPHTARSTIGYINPNRLVRTPHPLFSPNLVPLDFYLFVRMKTALMEVTFEDDDQLFQGVIEVLHRIPATNSKQFLMSGSLDWMHAFREPEIMSNEGNLLNTFLFFYLEVIWPH
jgi:hypothetical protein